MKKGLLFLLLSFHLQGYCQSRDLYLKKVFVHKGDSMPYRILFPENYDPVKTYPLVLFLHGSGERGKDNTLQLLHGSELFLRDSIRKNYPAIVVFPQCGKESYWSNVDRPVQGGKQQYIFKKDGEATQAMQMLQRLVKDLQKNYRVRSKEIYGGGLSMGAMGILELARRQPRLFASAFAICGGADTSTAKKIRKTSWWLFHGAKDDLVIPAHSENLAAALRKAGADVRLTIYPGANHNSWDAAFAEKGLISWLFSNKK